ncbi:MAG: HEAT repeat domain-containing protein [Planctomycetaceae bacterium]|jgi:hypothetical protein|nr:HEAT repeat domain-containing protein [Planctomycetaceae bacterium]
MYFLKKLFEFILFPLDIIGDIFVRICDFIRILAGKFFLSVWGLIVPAAILIAIVLAFFVAQNQRDLAADYATQLMNCDDNEIEQLVGILRNLELAGLIELISCLRSDREKIFFACQNAIEDELQKLPTLTDEKKRDKIYLTLTDAMLKQTPQFKPVAKNVVNQFVRQIMTDFINLKSNGRSHDLQLATLNCERIQATIEPALRRGKNENGELQKPITKKIARYNAGGFHDELLAADGKPFRQTIQNKNEISDEVEYIADNNTPRKLNSDPYNNNNNLPQKIFPYPTNPNENLTARTARNSPTNLSANQYNPAEPYNPFPVLPELDNANEKIADQYNADKKNIRQNKEPIQNSYSDSRSNLRYGVNNYSDDSDDAKIFLTDDLRNINLNRISSLPTAQLMRLLQHSDSNRVLEARRILIVRDGFGEQHLTLAYKLYHRNPAIRKEIISHLTETHGVLANAWLAELLNDPNNEIRYNAASLLSTSADPNTRKLLIEKCQHDADNRIVNLINQLEQR